MEGVREGPEEGTLGASVLLFCFVSVTLAWNVPSWGDDTGPGILMSRGLDPSC